MTRYFIGAVLFVLIMYGCIEALPLIMGPSLSITSPAENAAFPGGIVTIEGRADRSAAVMLNGMALLHDQRGDFSSTLTFPRGGSILTFVATDRFGRKVVATRSIFVPFEN